MDNPRSRLNLCSARQVMNRSCLSFFSNFPILFFVSLILFCFKITVEHGILHLSSFIEEQTAFQSLFTQNSGSGNGFAGNGDNPEPENGKNAGNRRPFVLFTRGGFLNDDFFADELMDQWNPFGGSIFPAYRITVTLKGLLLSGYDDDEGDIKMEPFTVSGYKFGGNRFLYREIDDLMENFEGFGRENRGFGWKFGEGSENSNGSGKVFGGKVMDEEIVAAVNSGSLDLLNRVLDEKDEKNETDLRFSGENRPINTHLIDQELVLNRQDAANVIFLVFGVSSAFGWLLVVFIELYSCVLGIVSFTVISSLLGMEISLLKSIWVGCKSGISRLTVLVMLKWAVREALTQFLSIWFFSGVTDQHTLVSLIMRLKLMPFSINSPWIQEMGLDREISLRAHGFLFTWFFADLFLSMLCTVDCWVAVMDTRRSIEYAVIEGCRLMYVMLPQALVLKGFESIFGGLFVRSILAKMFGVSCATLFQSMVETYFMVVWLIFYFSAKSKSSRLNSRRFGWRDLGELLERNR